MISMTIKSLGVAPVAARRDYHHTHLRSFLVYTRNRFLSFPSFSVNNRIVPCRLFSAALLVQEAVADHGSSITDLAQSAHMHSTISRLAAIMGGCVSATALTNIAVVCPSFAGSVRSL